MDCMLITLINLTTQSNNFPPYWYDLNKDGGYVHMYAL